MRERTELAARVVSLLQAFENQALPKSVRTPAESDSPVDVMNVEDLGAAMQCQDSTKPSHFITPCPPPAGPFRVERRASIVLMVALLHLHTIYIPARAQGMSPEGTKPENTRHVLRGEYLLARDEDEICIPFTKNLNLFRELDFDDCHPRLPEHSNEFSRPRWAAEPLDIEIARRAFLGIALEFPKQQEDAILRWEQWLGETASLRIQGKLGMWSTEVDINNDGTPERIVRVQYGAPASSLPIKQRGCVFSHSGLWDTTISGQPLLDGMRHFYFGRDSDIIYFNALQRYYTIEWSETQAGPILEGRAIGATRGVIVRLARNANYSPVPVCYINWVPTAKAIFSQKQSLPVTHKY